MSVKELEDCCVCKMTRYQPELMDKLIRHTIYRGTDVVKEPISIGAEGIYFNTISIKVRMQCLEWEIEMYKKLLILYKEKQYLPGYFKNSLEAATKDLRELRRFIHSRYYLHQNAEDTSTWD